jgi:hypothetical protein
MKEEKFNKVSSSFRAAKLVMSSNRPWLSNYKSNVASTVISFKSRAELALPIHDLSSDLC